MAEGLCSFSSAVIPSVATSDGVGGGSGVGGPGLVTLFLLQERLDVVAVVAALGPWMTRWRAEQPDVSTSLLEVCGCVGGGRVCLVDSFRLRVACRFRTHVQHELFLPLEVGLIVVRTCGEH